MISKQFFNNLPDFPTYYDSIKQLFADGKTTGSNQTEKFLNYTALTLARTKRGLKTLHPSQEIIETVNSSNRKKWLLITEAWCGDAGNIIPFIYNLSKSAQNIDLRIALRDENPDLIDLFLTNGGRSIPIFIAMNEDMQYIDHWGPRPNPAQQIVMDHKNHPARSYEEMQVELQKWYLADKAQTLQDELIAYFRL